MVTSRSVPQQIAQMLSPLAGQNLFAFRILQMGQINYCSSCLTAGRVVSLILDYATTFWNAAAAQQRQPLWLLPLPRDSHKGRPYNAPPLPHLE